MGFLRTALCREGQRGFTNVFLDFYLEEYDLFSRAGEVGFFACGFNDFNLIVGLDVHGNILDVLFHGEQGYRNFDHVSRGEQTRHRDVEHQRFVDFRALRGRTIASVVLGNDHCAYFPDVFRHPEGVCFLFPALDSKRTFKDYHGSKTIAFPVFFRFQGFVTSHGKCFLQASPEGSDNIVIEVPRFHAECFSCIECGEGVRGLERGQG